MIILSIVFVITCNKEKESGTDDWYDLKSNAIVDLLTHSGWSSPVLLPSKINTSGWEDSANITPDGTRLYWAYFRGDIIHYFSNGGGLPENFWQYQSGPDYGNDPVYSIDAFYSTKTNSIWSSPASFQYNIPIFSEVGMQIVGDDVYYGSEDRNNPYTPNLFLNGTDMGSPISSSSYQEDDPNYNNNPVYGEEIFFWSENRPCYVRNPDSPDEPSSCTSWAKHNIWRAKKTGGVWGPPELLNSPINSDNADFQPFLFIAENGDQYLYFSTDRGDNDDFPEIYRSKRIDEDNWEEPIPIITIPKNHSNLLAVAEPTLTQDGKNLYFIIIYKNKADDSDPNVVYDSDIAYVKHE
jgi:hypothetical protein